MQIVSPELISGKKVLLRLDIDVPLGQEGGRRVVLDDFRLRAGLPTLKLCLEHAEKVIVMGHIGRPDGKETAALSVEPIYDWLEENLEDFGYWEKLKLLENLRFETGEDKADLEYAKSLASLGDFFVNEAFAAHHKAASTTVLPTLLPHSAGLHFMQEVEKLTRVRETPKRPLVAIIGGAKLEDKLPAIEALAKIADTVLVGGKLVSEIGKNNVDVSVSVVIGKLNEAGLDLSSETIGEYCSTLKRAKQVVWAGPVGKYEDTLGNEGDRRLAQTIIDSGAESIVGGGDTIAALNKLGVLNQISFVSIGGGAMLKFLTSGILPTIEALS